jgi:class 3 adenylate cyclase
MLVHTMVVWWRSFAFRFVATYSVTVILVVLLGLWGLYEREKEDVVGKFGLVLEAIATTIAPQIDGQLLDRIHSDQDTQSSAFQSTRSILERVMRDNRLREDQIYILRPKGGDSYEFVVMLQQTSFVGDRYLPPDEVRARYSRVLNRAVATRTALYRDAHGSFISGLAPITRPDGSVAAILQVDFGVDQFLEEVAVTARLYLGGLVLLILFFIVFGIAVHKRLSADIFALVEGTHAIEAQNYAHEVRVRGRDEFSVVASALNKAIRGLKERFEMLKFLPKHTAKMIKEASRGGGVSRAIATRVETVVFTTDIRGFTSLSEAWSAERVVKMLNQFICVQAEIVSKYDGSIDKYMGDAVLAVFQGEGKERRSVECAIEIQTALKSMNEKKLVEKPILIGIGITVGELVMGNMGSDERMEYTIIGSTVNLASRLCGKAEGEVTIVSEEIYRRTGDLPQIHFGMPMKVEVKGFDEPVTCYSVRSASA